MPRFLVALLAATLPIAAPAQAPEYPAADLAAAAKLRDRALQGTGAWDIVASLSTEIGPRIAGSEGDRAAVGWALNKLTSLGFQNVRAEDVIVPQWVRGSIDVAITEPFPQTLAGVALGGSIGTADEGIEADILAVADIDALRTLSRADVEGRIVYISRRTARTRDGSGYATAVRGRTEGASVASALGAVAIVIRSIGTDSDRFAHTGSVRYTPNVPRIPAVALSNPDADLLEGQLATGRAVTLRVRSSARDLPQRRSANVVGELIGSAAPEEIVLLGAHLDSWDLGTGALDDGAGVAIVTEAVRLIRALELAPRRTLRVVLFANEEFGLNGATAYSVQSGAEIDKHVIAMEADFGDGPVWRFETQVADAALAGIAPIANLLKPLGIERGGNSADGGADIGPLRRLGVPVFGLTHDGMRYFDYHHTANDTLDKVDRKALDQAVAAYATAAFLAANARGNFGRLPAAADGH